ncbi:MAG: DUF1934 domain-containing protein [Oscillospiraceae bacterium]|jgi:uncharacterized beta-barrel protein YwiB (DUF1934 family)|nr:DUF1934 domain-containing protein [Oscillospiraceae bacterium]
MTKSAKKLPVVIEICDYHEFDGESMSSEMMCDGMLEELPQTDGGGWRIHYVEQAEGIKGSKSALRVQNRMVSLSRYGEFPLEITLEQGVRHNCYYHTPAGMMHLGVYARTVDSSLTADGGSVKLHYTLDYFSEMMSSNRMEIFVHPIALRA